VVSTFGVVIPRLWLRQGYLPPREAKFIAMTDYFWHAAK
jgi:hypothetical protein